MRFVIVFFWSILLLIEWRCWSNWSHGYFRKGFLLISKRIYPTNRYVFVVKNLLSSNDASEENIGKLSFKKLSEREVGVRNKHFLLPPVRGRVIFFSENSIKIRIYIDWFMLFLLFYIIPLAIWSEGPINPVADILGFIGGILMFYIMLIESFSIFLKHSGKEV